MKNSSQFSVNNDPQLTSLGIDGWETLGRDWKKYQYPRHMRLKNSPIPTRYRGIGEHLSSTFSTHDSSLADPKSMGKTCSVPLKQPQKIVTNTMTKVHIENIRLRLEHRLKIAQAKGDEQLISLLHQESQYLLSF